MELDPRERFDREINPILFFQEAGGVPADAVAKVTIRSGEEMRALGTTHPNGKPLPKVHYEPPVYGAFSSFYPVYFAPIQKLPVYSGPGEHCYRGANGKAMAGTNGIVYGADGKTAG